MSTRNVAENLASHLAIRDLCDRYTDAVNQRDWEALKACFASNGVWDVGGGNPASMTFLFEGADAVARGIASLVSSMELCIQSNHAVVITVEGSRARVRSTLQEIARPSAAQPGVILWGTYNDDVVREEDGEWRFRKRTFRYTVIDQASIAGEAFARMPR